MVIYVTDDRVAMTSEKSWRSARLQWTWLSAKLWRKLTTSAGRILRTTMWIVCATGYLLFEAIATFFCHANCWHIFGSIERGKAPLNRAELSFLDLAEKKKRRLQNNWKKKNEINARNGQTLVVSSVKILKIKFLFCGGCNTVKVRYGRETMEVLDLIIKKIC